jgi:hypothetical protein
MRGLAAFIMQGRAQAVLAIAVLTAVSWGFPLVSLIAAAAVALPTLRRGAAEGAILITAAALAVAFAGWLVSGSPLQAVGHSLILWGLVWLTAVLLRESGRLALALTGAAGLGLVLVGGVYWVIDDPAGLWRDEMQHMIRPLLEQQPRQEDPELLLRSMSALARYFTGAIAAGSVLTVTLSLLLARWWQAMLFNPGGFRTEFHGLRLPAVWAYLWLALLGFATTGAELAANLAVPVAIPFLLAGFAVLHALLSRTGAGRFWLMGIYVGLAIMAPLIVPVLLIGFSDIWIDWRQRFSQA